MKLATTDKAKILLFLNDKSSVYLNGVNHNNNISNSFKCRLNIKRSVPGNFLVTVFVW